MAANQYTEGNAGDPNQTDTSNGSGDWWTNNAPAAPASFQSNITGPAPTTGIGAGANAPGTASNPIPPTGVPNPYDPTKDTAGYPMSVASPTATWGGPIAPFQYNPQGSGYPTFTPPPLPDSLKNPFTLPTAAELQGTPGYMERFQMGLRARDRSAAARGTILNGGTQQALSRYGQDYASGEYGNLVGQKLQERGQQANDYLNLAYGPAWQQNTGAVNQYGQLYKQYQDLNANNRLAQTDYWGQQMDLLNAGLKAASAGSPGSTGGQG